MSGRTEWEKSQNEPFLDGQISVDYDLSLEKMRVGHPIGITSFGKLQLISQCVTIKRNKAALNMTQDVDLINDDACASIIIKWILIGAFKHTVPECRQLGNIYETVGVVLTYAFGGSSSHMHDNV